MKGNPVNKIDSTSDNRTANNAARHQYRVLSDEEKAEMQEIKDMGAAFIAKLHSMDLTHPFEMTDELVLSDRNLELARQHVEDAVMRAVRFITA